MFIFSNPRVGDLGAQKAGQTKRIEKRRANAAG